MFLSTPSVGGQLDKRHADRQQVKYDEREAFPEKYAATRKKMLPDETGSSAPAPAVRGVGSNLGDMGF